MVRLVTRKYISIILSLLICITSITPASASTAKRNSTDNEPVSNSVYLTKRAEVNSVSEATYHFSSQDNSSNLGPFTLKEIDQIKGSFSPDMIQLAAYYYPVLTKLLSDKQIQQLLEWSEQDARDRTKTFSAYEHELFQKLTPIVIQKLTPPKAVSVQDEVYRFSNDVSVSKSVYATNSMARAIRPEDLFRFEHVRSNIPFKVKTDGFVDLIHRTSVQQEVDIFLEGKNGLDFSLIRTYNSLQANLQEFQQMDSYDGSCHYYALYDPGYSGGAECPYTLRDIEHRNHIQVATGWSFNFPTWSYGSLEGTELSKTSGQQQNYGYYNYVSHDKYFNPELEEIRENIITLEDGTTYRFKKNETTPYNYPYDNVKLAYHDLEDFYNGSVTLVINDQITYTFNRPGTEITKTNQYGDKITYNKGYITPAGYIYSITDTIGRKISMTVMRGYGVIGNVTVTDPNGQTLKSIYYDKSDIMRNSYRIGRQLNSVKDELTNEVLNTYTYYPYEEWVADANPEDDYKFNIDGSGNAILDITVNGQGVDSSLIRQRDLATFQTINYHLLKEATNNMGFTTHYTYQSYDPTWKENADYVESNRKRGTIRKYVDQHALQYKGYHPVVNVYHKYKNSNGEEKILSQSATGVGTNAPEVWTGPKHGGISGAFHLSGSGSYRSGDVVSNKLETNYGTFTNSKVNQYFINKHQFVAQIEKNVVVDSGHLSAENDHVQYGLASSEVTSYKYDAGTNKPYLVAKWSDDAANDPKPQNIRDYLLNGNRQDQPANLVQYATFTKMEYDSRGNVIRQEDSLNNRSEMAYQGVNNQLSMRKDISADGQTITQSDYVYEHNPGGKGHGKLKKMTTQLTYRNPANIGEVRTDTMVKDYEIQQSTGVVSKITESSSGTQYSQQPLTVVKELGYDGNNNHVTSEKTLVQLNPDSNATKLASGYEYDILDRLTKRTYPDGSAANYQYDSKNRITVVTFIPSEPNQWQTRTTKYFYDDLRRIVTEEMPDGTKAVTTYTPYGEVELQKQVANNGHERIVMVNRTDATGKLLTESIPFNQAHLKTTSTYGPFGVKSVTNALQQTTTTSYANAAFRPDGSMSQLQMTTKTVEPDGREVWTFNDPYGRVMKQVEKSASKERVTTFQYNSLGKMIQKTVTGDGKTQQTYYGYDGAGNLAYLKDDKGQVHTYVYDAHGGMFAWYINGAKQKGTKYNEVGWPLIKTNAAGAQEKYEYKSNGLVEKYTDKANQVYQYSYTPYYEEDSLTIKNTAGAVLYWKKNAYDNATRLLTAVSNSENTTMGYSYDIWKRLSSQSTVNRTYTFGYDASDRMSTLTYPDGQVATYSYDNIHRIKTISYPGMGTVTYNYHTANNENRYDIEYPGGFRQEKKTDAFKELTAQTGPNWSETFAYDGMGNIKTINRNGAAFSYQYDGLNRIEQEGGAGGNKSYTYDTRGNRLTISGSQEYTYNEVNHLTSMRGNIQTEQGSQEFGYNALNQLISFKNDVRNSATYSYYGDGLRATKTVDGNFTRYVYLKGKVIEELNWDGSVKARNIWGNELLWRQDNTTNKSGYYYYNGHGDVVAIKDAAGNSINTYDYDIWGNVLGKTEGMNNPYRYTGEPQDDESGLIYLRARYYDPTVGRFISQDTYEGDLNNPLSLNLYTYVENNPLRYTDPTGHYKDSDNDELRDLISPYTERWNDAQDRINNLDTSSPDYADSLSRLQDIQRSAEMAADNAREAYYYQQNQELPSDVRFHGVQSNCPDCASPISISEDPIAQTILTIAPGGGILKAGQATKSTLKMDLQLFAKSSGKWPGGAMSGKDAVKFLKKEGFEEVSQNGSHLKLKGPNGNIVIVPVHGSKSLPTGTLKSIRDMAGYGK